jgi:hypothetical protein
MVYLSLTFKSILYNLFHKETNTMSRHYMPITKEIASKVRQVVVGYDRPLGSFYFQVWDVNPDNAIEPLNESLTEYMDIDELFDAIHNFLGNLIGKTYEYPFSGKFCAQLMQEQEGSVSTGTCAPWRD